MKIIRVYLIFPLQYWHADPCQPSWHTQVPLTQLPLTQLFESHVDSDDDEDEEEDDDAVAVLHSTATHNKTIHKNIHGIPDTSLLLLSYLDIFFRRYLDLYRNRNICMTSAILIGFHVRWDNGRWRRKTPLAITHLYSLCWWKRECGL